MDDKTLKKLAVVCSLAGLLMLFYISQTIKLEETKINDLGPDDVSRTVKIIGNVDSFQQRGKVNMFKINQIVGIDVVSFDDISAMKDGDPIEAVGEYREIKGKKELILDEIKKPKSQNRSIS